MALDMVRLEGIEPPTDGLEIRCSIQLSYRRSWSGNNLGLHLLERTPHTLADLRRFDHNVPGSCDHTRKDMKRGPA